MSKKSIPLSLEYHVNARIAFSLCTKFYLHVDAHNKAWCAKIVKNEKFSMHILCPFYKTARGEKDTFITHTYTSIFVTLILTHTDSYLSKTSLRACTTSWNFTSPCAYMRCHFNWPAEVLLTQTCPGFFFFTFPGKQLQCMRRTA